LFLNGTLVAEHADTPRTPSADFELGTGFVGNIKRSAFSPSPKPTSIGLIGLAGLGLLGRRRRDVRA
jgi:MYXO-CTERM domain-containing protein